jgi:acyl dehydratase
MGFGTEQDGLAWRGRTDGPAPCDDPISHRDVRAYAALVRDANASYWDRSWATEAWGGVLSPPGALMIWHWPLPWVPEGIVQRAPMLASRVPLPGDRVVNASTCTEFHAPVLVGDVLTVVETVEDVSTERSTALGPGHFVTTVARYTNGAGVPVATHRNIMLRYLATEQAASAAPATGADGEQAEAGEIATVTDPRPGDRLPAISLPVTLETCVQDVSATRDFLPVHYDPGYARESGAEHAFLNTMFTHGFLDRVCTDWAGPLARVTRRDVRLASPVLVGQDVSVGGRLTGIERAGDALDVSVRLHLTSGGRTAGTCNSVIRLPAADDRRTTQGNEE